MNHTKGEKSMFAVSKSVRSALVLALGLGAAGQALAHGESIRGAGAGSINTMGAAILEDTAFGFRWDQRNYTTFTDQQMVDFRVQGEDVHQHEREDAYFFSFGFPVNEDLDINFLFQYNNFQGFKDNGDAYAINCFDPNGDGTVENPSTSCISPTKESPGFGDTLVTGRYRFYNDGTHQVASVFGLIIPTGNIRNRTDNGELIGTHNQPGGGGTAYQMGFAYTGHLSEKIAMDAGLIWRFYEQGAKQFRPGNSYQVDLAVSYDHHGKFTPTLEVNGIFAQQDIENDEIKKNSGGDTVYLSPGLSYHVNKNQSIYANFWKPIYQNLDGIQNDEAWRFSIGWGYGFSSH